MVLASTLWKHRNDQGRVTRAQGLWRTACMSRSHSCLTAGPRVHSWEHASRMNCGKAERGAVHFCFLKFTLKTCYLRKEKLVSFVLKYYEPLSQSSPTPELWGDHLVQRQSTDLWSHCSVLPPNKQRGSGPCAIWSSLGTHWLYWLKVWKAMCCSDESCRHLQSWVWILEFVHLFNNLGGRLCSASYWGYSNKYDCPQDLTTCSVFCFTAFVGFYF